MNKIAIHKIEALFLIGIVRNKAFLVKFINIIKEADFDLAINSKIYGLIRNHFLQYKDTISLQTAIVYYQKYLMEDQDSWVVEKWIQEAFMESIDIQYDFLEIEFLEVVKERRKIFLSNLISSSKWNHEQFSKVMSEISSLGMATESTGFVEKINTWGERKVSYRNANKVKTGIPELDIASGGGLTPGEYAMFLGPTGSGKSTLMQNLCYHGILGGTAHNGIHFSTENPIDMVIDRYVSRFLQKPFGEIEAHAVRETNGNIIEYVKRELVKVYRWDISERLHFQELLGTKALVSNIRAFISQLRDVGFVPNFIVVDDIDNMVGNESFNPKASKNQRLEEASVGLKDLAASENIVVYSVGQMKTSKYNDDDIALGSSGSWSREAKEQTPSVVMFNKQSKEESKRDDKGLCYSRLECAKTRNFPKMTREVILIHDYRTQSITCDISNENECMKDAITRMSWEDLSDDQIKECDIF